MTTENKWQVLDLNVKSESCDTGPQQRGVLVPLFTVKPTERLLWLICSRISLELFSKRGFSSTAWKFRSYMEVLKHFIIQQMHKNIFRKYN